MHYIAKISRPKFNIYFFYTFKDVPIAITQDMLSKRLNLVPVRVVVVYVVWLEAKC